MVHAQNSVMVVHCLVANDKSIISSRTDSLPSPFSVTDGKNQQKTRKHSSRSLTACLLTVGQTPSPPCGQTDTCKNITLATTSLRPVKVSACLLTVGGVQGCVCPRGVSRGCANPPVPGRHPLLDPEADTSQTQMQTVDRQTSMKTLPCPKLRLRAVIIGLVQLHSLGMNYHNGRDVKISFAQGKLQVAGEILLHCIR